MKPKLLVYLHGFNSSPRSHKASLLGAYCAHQHPSIEYWVPQLSPYPQAAIEQILARLAFYPAEYCIGLIGSSLGGFYATWLAEQLHCRAVLINPAVNPDVLLMNYLGEQRNPYTQESYVLELEHMQQLAGLKVPSLRQPENLWLLQQKGDEVLDYRQAVAAYKNSKQTLEEGGDHSFVEIERYFNDIVDFLFYSID